MQMDTNAILYKIADKLGLKRDSMEDRLKLQKTVYLLQTLGAHLGYGFSWYKYGPYSQELVYDAYRALHPKEKKYAQEAAEFDFAPKTKKWLDQFRQTLGPALNDLKQLELLASVDFVRKAWLEPEATETETTTEFRQHKTCFFNGDLISDDEIKNACKTLDEAKQALPS